MQKNYIYFLLFYANFAITYEQQNWHQWGRQQQYSCQQLYNPASKEEVVQIIKRAYESKTAIRVIGSSHSWSYLINTPGIIIATDKLNHILAVDNDQCRVMVEGGIKVKDLISQLADLGMAISNQGFIMEQSIAGAIATATHGTGKNGTMSDFVEGIELIDAEGNLHTIDAIHNNELLPHVRVHLGALGFIYSVTIQCEPLFILSHERFMMPLDKVCCDYMNFIQTHDHFMFMCLPDAQNALVFFWDRTKEKITRNKLRIVADSCVFDRNINTYAIKFFSIFPRIAPSLLYAGLETLQRARYSDYCYKTLSPIYHALTVQNYIEEEFAIAVENFNSAFSDLKQLYKKYALTGNNIIGLITCRFSPANFKSPLSLNYARDTAFITINILKFFPEYELFFQELELIMHRYHGRPHWGKFHGLTLKDVMKIYGSDCEIFNAIRHRFDPEGIFSNDCIRRWFGESDFSDILA